MKKKRINPDMEASRRNLQKIINQNYKSKENEDLFILSKITEIYKYHLESKNFISFTINRFYFSLWIINLIFLNWLFFLELVYPRSMNFLYFSITMVIGILSIIINIFNAFPKKE